jgi:hypothetical protein
VIRVGFLLDVLFSRRWVVADLVEAGLGEGAGVAGVSVRRTREWRGWKGRFLRAYLEKGTIGRACGEEGVCSRSVVYVWLKEDVEFAARFKRVREQVRKRRAAKVRRERVMARRKEGFLRKFLKFGLMSRALGKSGPRGHAVVYKWMKKDGEFAEKFKRVKEEVSRGEVAKVRRKGEGGRRMERMRARRKELFLRKFLERGLMSLASRAVGMRDASLVYTWLKGDVGFAESFKWAKEEVRKRVKEEGRRPVRDGPRVMLYYRGLPIVFPGGSRLGEECEWSDEMLMARLRELKPEMYGAAGDRG